jgi:hypothetical protein
MIVHGFVQKDALAASVHSYLRQRQFYVLGVVLQTILDVYIYIYIYFFRYCCACLCLKYEWTEAARASFWTNPWTIIYMCMNMSQW